MWPMASYAALATTTPLAENLKAYDGNGRATPEYLTKAGANYDQSEEIEHRLHSHNLETAYGVSVVGNSNTETRYLIDICMGCY
jgi:hypothetical protein